jgi:hypothetical protein
MIDQLLDFSRIKMGDGLPLDTGRSTSPRSVAW